MLWTKQFAKGAGKRIFESSTTTSPMVAAAARIDGKIFIKIFNGVN